MRKYFNSKKIILIFISILVFQNPLLATEQQKILKVLYHGPIAIEEVDPHRYNFTFQYLLAENLFQPLLRLDADGSYQLDAAEDIQFIDEKRIIITLRDDLYWSDGQPVIAADYVAGIRRAMLPEHKMSGSALQLKGGARLEHYAKSIEGLRILDDKTLSIETTTIVKSFIHKLDRMMPVPTHLKIRDGEDWGSQTTVSNGRYIISKDSNNERLILEKNTKFRSKDTAKIAKIEFPALVLDTALRKFIDKEVDLILDVPFKQLGWVKKNVNESFFPMSNNNTLYLTFDFRSKELSNKSIREAMYLAINRDKLSKTAFGGLGGALYTVLPPELSTIDTDASVDFEKNLILAKELLESQGYSAENPYKFKLAYYDILTFRTVALALKHSWSSINISVELVHFEGDFNKLIAASEKGEFAGFVGTTSFNGEAREASLRHLLNFNASSPFTSWYKNDEYARIMSDIQSSQLPAEQRQLVSRAENHLLNKHVTLPISWFPTGALVSSDLINADRVLRGPTSPLYYLEWRDALGNEAGL